MAYDDALAARVREAVARRAEHEEIAMFGGLSFMVNTHLAVGLIRDDLLVNVGKGLYDEAIANGAQPMVMGARTMRGMVRVPAADLADQEMLERWLGPAVERALAKPRKPPKPVG
jgi:TfoX/Sxy family transcriptional regulator of competence genes